MAMATLADELTCPVCLEFYKDPRLLPCHHSLCKSCLVALRSKKENNIDCEVQCPSCRHLFQAKDETHIESLPKNFTLASIVCKFQESLKGDGFCPCDVCEEGQKGRAIKKCLQCQFSYCRICLEQLHPKRGALANHKLVYIMDAYGEKYEHEEPRSACLSLVSENQSVAAQKYDQLKRARYCMSCDEFYTKGDQSSTEGNHEHHDTVEIQSAFRKKREEFECILARLLDEDQDLEKELADITSLIETIQKMVEEKKVELVQRFGEMAEEVERRKMSAVNRIEEEMKMRITSLESHLRELEVLKVKTKIKIAAFSELSSLTNEDSSIFLIKLKELQNEIGPVTGDYIKRATIGTECDSSLPTERLMNEIIANAMQDICPSERRLQIPDPNLADTDISLKQVSMAIKVTNVQKDGAVSADIEWVAIHHVDHYEISYFCDPGETVLRRNIVENRCRLTTLRWDSEYTVTITAYLSDGKTSFDSTVFKTNHKVKDPNLAETDISSKQVSMAIKVTNVQKDGAMSADVQWMAIYQVDHYEISYFCDPQETVLQRNIVENRCRLTTLRWDSEYTVIVTAYLSDGKTSFDSTVFKTDPKVKDTKPTITDISPKHVKMAVKVTNVQKAGTMSADVEWLALYQPGQYEVSYFCNPDETVVLKKIAKNGCRLTNLRWDSTYTIKVTTQLHDGMTVFDEQSFKTDPQVKCFPMAASEICNDKITATSSFDEFTASDRTKGMHFNKIGEFSGIVFTPVLTENKHFWTMHFDLSIFRPGKNRSIYLDFGITNYSSLNYEFGLTRNKAAQTCAIVQENQRDIYLQFFDGSVQVGPSTALNLQFKQKNRLQFGFFYDKYESVFAVLDLQSQNVLHVFYGVVFEDDADPVFAVSPYHTFQKMRVNSTLRYENVMEEDLSYWMLNIKEYSYI